MKFRCAIFLINYLTLQAKLIIHLIFIEFLYFAILNYLGVY